jgi:predicted aldo/keto reductase-like oxidoreductase
MTQMQLDDIRKNVGDNMNSVCTGCGYCMPCPAEINIPAYMQLYNEKQMFNKSGEEMIKAVKSARSWGTLVATIGHSEDCMQCSKCERACTQHLNIIERLEEMAKWEEHVEG